MLINKVCEEVDDSERAGHSSLPEYRTANELFEIMTQNTRFDSDNNSLSAQELVLLYQNMELGTRLMSDATELAVKKPNQYVETIVYNEQEDPGSDTDSEIYTNAEIHDVFTANQERIDFLNNSSLENLLCHKLGGIAMHSSDPNFEYDKKCLFQDPYIKNQLKNYNVFNSSSDSDNLFSTSLIDYICCKRLEDNYNFYMDNIIRYVQHTIEQLKRISNGDYLTDRAKEKWREVISTSVSAENDPSTKVLATSTSIPLHVECKATGKATWDELVRSEVDVRSLSKILEKKIIVEIPKVICGSYRLYSRRCADNLIISCQKEKEKNSQDSRVDVVLKLQRSQTGHVISNISSIMVLKTTPALSDLRNNEILALPSPEKSGETSKLTGETCPKETAITVIEIIKTPIPAIPEDKNEGTVVKEITEDVDEHDGSYAGTNDYPFSERNASCASILCSSGTSLVVKDADKPLYPTNQNQCTYNIISPPELLVTMRKLNMRYSTLEENAEDSTSQSTSKKRSPVRVRIKSPYENKSFSIEEKKRKRLLEIRERREKRKLALSENCKITKHKYAKGAIMPQASSSVTKLSITNRSFYNSIYGQNNPMESKPRPKKPKNTPDVSLHMEDINEDCFESPMVSPDKNSTKYINRSYFLDEAETEMTYLQPMKSIESPHSTTNSVISTEFNEHLDLIKQLIIPSETNLTNDLVFHPSPEMSCSEVKPLFPIAEYENKTMSVINHDNVKPSGDECRKSIDQLYDLMKQFGKHNTPTEGKTLSKVLECNDVGATDSIHGSESGSSVKHSPQSQNIASKSKSIKPQTPGPLKSAMASKQSPKPDADKSKKDRNKRVVISPPYKGPLPENPLKAISQLLHEFESAQKNKHKSSDAKPNKKTESPTNDPKSYSRQGSYRRKSRLDEHRDNQQNSKLSPGANPKDKRSRPVPSLDSARVSYQQEPHNLPKKKIADMIDEVKEARGEAVRGPSKFHSRLDSLAQPKKSYVQAHNTEYQTRYGRNMLLADRLQKLATTKSASAPDRPSQLNKTRWRKGPEVAAGPSVKQRAPSVPLLEQRKTRAGHKRRSASSSPESPSQRSPRRRRSPNINKPDSMGKKMVEVESYLKNHFRGTSRERQNGLRCRVPFVPHDIEIASLRLSSGAEDTPSISTALHMFDAVVGPGLTALAECSESLVASEPPRSDSDYCVNILEDRYITTAVGLCNDSTSESLHQHPNSTTEIEKLESALYSHISGSFQKRLRIKNLTLTPKTSMQQLFLLQSGDAGSVLMKSVSSIKLDRRSVQSLHELKTMPVLSNSHLDWRFAQLPNQIATVGYAFTQKSPSTSGSRVMLTEVPIAETRERVQQASQSSQCFRGVSDMPLRDASAQVDSISEENSNVAAVADDDQNATNPEAPQAKETIVDNKTQIDTILPVNEICNDNMDEETEMDTKEDCMPRKECSDTSPVAPAPSFETPEYTTSLDMLVGLLNEIQKITCQNQIAATDQPNTTELIPSRKNTVSQLENPHRKLISMSSLENLRQLESNASIFTYYMSNNDTATSSNNKMDSVVELKKALKFSDASVECPKISVIKENVAVEVKNPVGVDKEVSANLCKESADTCTNVPSSITAVTYVDKMCARFAITGPSSHSGVCVRQYHSSNALRAPAVKKIIELPQIERSTPRTLISHDTTDLKDKSLTNFASIRKIENIKSDKGLSARCEIGKYCVKNIDLDPMLRFKRDILVSVYSILVLTVFAALSFPELLIYQS